MSTTQIVILVAALAVLAFVMMRRRRRHELQERFGAEYDRAVAEHDSRVAAERDLRERERRVAELELRDLPDESRTAYAARWRDVQATFVDDPAQAVDDADELVTRMLAEIGYPVDDRERQLADLSVDHAAVLEAYREAHEISSRSRQGRAATEELRNAIVDFRQLVTDLLGGDPTALGAETPPAADRAASPDESTGRATTPVEVDPGAQPPVTVEHGDEVHTARREHTDTTSR